MTSYPLLIGWRFFRAGSGNRLVSFVSLLAVAGLVLGVALMILVLAVMNGFDREMRTRILGLVPHVQLSRDGGIADWQTLAPKLLEDPAILSATPFVRLGGMVNFHGRVVPVELLGASVSAGSRYAALGPLVREDGLLLSRRIADRLGAKEGDALTLFVAGNDNSGRGATPVARAFRVTGIFATHTTLDNALVVTRLETAAALAGLDGRVQGLQLELVDPFAARAMVYRLLALLPAGYHFTDWLQTHGNLYQAINMSRSLVGTLVFAVIAVAVFNVVALLVMTVVEKRPAIAILKTQGATRGGIIGVFVTQGSLIGLLGVGLGVLLGCLGALVLGDVVKWLENLLDFRFLNLAVYPIDYIPADLRARDVIAVALVALGLNFLAALYPAWRAAAVPPAQVLRYE
ncbi:MAG: FtsX-like permease family protein [Porticoccaceae bacterium]